MQCSHCQQKYIDNDNNVCYLVITKLAKHIERRWKI
nr:MAG TPA: Protein of unknown function (DUF983) [Caudoviricetes sp.]